MLKSLSVFENSTLLVSVWPGVSHSAYWPRSILFYQVDFK